VQSLAIVVRFCLYVSLSVKRVYCDKTTANMITRFHCKPVKGLNGGLNLGGVVFDFAMVYRGNGER